MAKSDIETALKEIELLNCNIVRLRKAADESEERVFELSSNVALMAGLKFQPSRREARKNPRSWKNYKIFPTKSLTGAIRDALITQKGDMHVSKIVSAVYAPEILKNKEDYRDAYRGVSSTLGRLVNLKEVERKPGRKGIYKLRI
tara:strand:+ start:984 stop:1418 length:435 start_codon:yes stop_codon:yes gene_type:complete